MAPFNSIARCVPRLNVRLYLPRVRKPPKKHHSPDQVAQGAGVLAHPRKQTVVNPAPARFIPWLMELAYPLGRFFILPFYFGRIDVRGREYLPRCGPVILAPTHRSRWDALMVPFAAGYHITGQHLHFMVTADEVKGLQGWLIQHMGGFAIDTKHPTVASLRHGVDLLHANQTLVIFPEGDIYRTPDVQPLKPGLARLALQSECSHPNSVQIVPIHVQYSHALVPWRSRVKIRIGPPLLVSEYRSGSLKQDAKCLTAALQSALERLLIGSANCKPG